MYLLTFSFWVNDSNNKIVTWGEYLKRIMQCYYLINSAIIVKWLSSESWLIRVQSTAG